MSLLKPFFQLLQPLLEIVNLLAQVFVLARLDQPSTPQTFRQIRHRVPYRGLERASAIVRRIGRRAVLPPVIAGGNGLATEYGLATLYGLTRLFRTAPVSREMVLNFVAQHSLGLPKSY